MIQIFKQSCLNRFFELEVAKGIKNKSIRLPTYLSLGTEHVPPAIKEAKSDWLVFPQHRCHSYFLTFGGSPESLAKELLGRKDGCNKGMGGSASVSIKPHFFGHSGLLGDQVPIAVGAAHASGKDTLVIVGDAGIEEDYALAAMGYAVSKKAPVLFLVEDNDLSILTPKSTRRAWNAVDVAKGFGMNAIDISDHPKTIYETVKTIRLPALVNVNVCRHYWHAGAGQDGEPKWNRYEEIKKELGQEAKQIENETSEQMEQLWQRLQRQ
jgi:pyruvate dehydrogenase E1 component alpha subunit